MQKTRFLYNAHAAGLSGKITRPFPATLEVQAPSALPTSGGYSSARRRNVRIRRIFHCVETHTEATGAFNNDKEAHDTSATASAQQFNLQDVVTADNITARVSSSHPTGQDVEPTIVLLGTGIVNLRVAGRDIELESLVDDYSDLSTMTSLRERYESDAAFRTKLQDLMMIGRKDEMEDSRLHKFFPWCHRERSDKLPTFRNSTILPLFRILNQSAPGFTVLGNVIYVQNFGRIHVGELVVSAYERRVNALHIDLGSPVDGTIDASSVGCNGSTNDPPVGN